MALVVIVAAIVVAVAYSALLAWGGYKQVASSKKGGTLFICDVHGPTRKYTIFPDSLEWETSEGQRRRGPVDVCVLCFENKIKEARKNLQK